MAALVIYAYGWRVTQIDLGVLVKDIHLVRPLVVNLLKPDLVAFETEGRTPEAIFLLNPNGPGPVVSGGGPAEGTLAVSPASGNIGDRVTVSGRGLVPNSNGRLYWVNAIEQEFPLGEVRAGPDGSFVREIVVPQTARGDVQTVRAVFTWRTGKWHFSETLKLCGEKMVETIFLALMATTFAVGVAGPLSFLAARNLMTRHAAGRGIYYLVRTLFNVLRSIEPLIMAILFAVWVGIGPFAGVLALGVHSIAALGKLFSEQIESIDPGPVEAITATGASPVQVVLFAVVPQVVPQFLALGFYRWDINVRMSTIIGFVGGGGIGFLLQQWINLLQYNQAGTALLSIALVVIGLDVASARIREKLERST
ncbi:MAG: phosphonate ABC transporter, permease protein PhnE [Nitrospinae bacterium CG11_big_fil_rev_8_21_14_0_20_56_8]|nr:MAG: phosphonate ABC transporter, permease protein PhnE [Nitrospinae bacterium CG11_big_fil_rev_8_21_14_0_20_56_8]